jgi:threonine dehydratase
MPLATPAIKWENVKRLGATVVLYGNDFDEAKKECMRLVEEEKRINIPPYDHPQVIAGQGTVAVEILRQCSMGKIDAIFCCVGGGGLISGVAAYVKRLYPNIKIIGVETVDSYAMFESLKTGKPVELQQVGLFADGAAVRLVGNETFRLCYEHLDGHILVTNDEICAAIKDIFEDTRSIVEPAGALSVAGLKKWIKINEGKQVSLDSLKFTATPDPNQRFLYNQKYNLLLSNKFIPSELADQQPTYIAVTSGANMNFNRLRFVADRAELGLNKEALISVVIPERPGAFIALHNLILPRAITSFTYRYSDPDHAYIFSSFSLLDPSQKKKEIRELFEQLEKNGMQATDLTNNELAKDHGRFLIGGRASVPDERLYRFGKI